MSLNGHSQRRLKSNGKSTKPVAAPWDANHFIRSYSEAIRDRLNLFFEITGLTHKPKLIAVTGLTHGSGASTLAAGLAASFSETGDGKVLLVDMNIGRTEVHPFFQGKPACPLTMALQLKDRMDSAADNLYLATAGESKEDGPFNVGLKRFHDLLPQLKASDFDYIIFDMPSVSQTNPTAAMARFMDKALFVVESEKCDRECVRRAYTDLVSNRSSVGVILNKVRSYAPRWVEAER
jgi:Mrp family chromosome partitioning ATPase